MRWKRRIIGWLACMAVAVASIGVPLPAMSAKKPGATPFPCQHCACGCADAETCWRDCCCFTNKQKLAWAKRNHVKPPAFALVAARREAGVAAGHEGATGSTAEERPPSPAGLRPCCAARAAADFSRACCRTGHACRSDDEQPASDAVAARRGDSPRVALLISKLRCRGLGLSVCGIPPSIVGDMPSATAIEPEGGERRPGEALLYEPPILAVSTPPPDLLRV